MCDVGLVYLNQRLQHQEQAAGTEPSPNYVPATPLGWGQGCVLLAEPEQLLRI